MEKVFENFSEFIKSIVSKKVLNYDIIRKRFFNNYLNEMFEDVSKNLLLTFYILQL